MNLKIPQYPLRVKHHIGMTLVELMVAMVISLIIMLAIGTVYTSSKRSYSVQDAYTKMQEGALYAFQYLGRNIRTAGYAGCNPAIINHISSTPSAAALYNHVDGVYGWDYKNTGAPGGYTIPGNITSTTLSNASASDWNDPGNTNPLYASLVGKVMPGSDVLVIKSAQLDNSLSTPSQDLTSTDTSIVFSTNTGIKQGQIMLISDCVGADLFVNSDSATSSTLSASTTCGTSTVCNQSGINWSHLYRAANIRIYKSTSTAYYVGLNANDVPALYSYSYENGFSSAPQELVDGVENMQVLYGVSTTLPDTADHFAPINQLQPGDLGKVYAIRISLLVRTTRKVSTPPPASAPAYNLVGVNNITAVQITAPKDTFLRHVYTATINLPNMSVRGRT